MKAITIWQPYAQAIAMGLKQYETRSWATKHRGMMAIHASIRPLSLQDRQLAEKYDLVENLQYGKIVAIGVLEDCVLITDELIAQMPRQEIDFGDWRPGRYAWKIGSVQPIELAEKILGKQGLWNWGENSDNVNYLPIMRRI